jgi:hypothetical protein
MEALVVDSSYSNDAGYWRAFFFFPFCEYFEGMSYFLISQVSQTHLCFTIPVSVHVVHILASGRICDGCKICHHQD